MITSFGGFLGRKGNGHPGPKDLWEGLLQLHTFPSVSPLPNKPASVPDNVSFFN